MQAIETRYKGYRFRSRIEARWATVFDAIGLAWEYEKQGFSLPSGPYLPDFWIPQLNAWFEIKGQDPTEDEKTKCRELRDQGVSAVVLISGSIGQQDGTVFCWEVADSGGGSCETMLLAFDLTDIGELYMVIEGQREYYSDQSFEKRLPVSPCVGLYPVPGCKGGIRLSRRVDERMHTAYEAGRSARFEHGESGAG